MQKLQILFDKEFDYIHTSSFVRKNYGFNHWWPSRPHVTRSDISEVYICTKRVKSSQLTLADFHVSEWRRRWRCYYGQEGCQTADDRSRRNHGVIKFQHVTHEMFRVHSSVTFILRIGLLGRVRGSLTTQETQETRGTTGDNLCSLSLNTRWWETTGRPLSAAVMTWHLIWCEKAQIQNQKKNV